MTNKNCYCVIDTDDLLHKNTKTRYSIAKKLCNLERRKIALTPATNL